MGKKNGRLDESTTTATSPDKDGFSLISNDKLIALYTNLLKCRIAEQRRAGPQRQGKTNGKPGSIRGHEAGTVGVAVDLGSEDAISSPDHGLLTGFSGGASIEALLFSSGLNGSSGKLHTSNAPLDAASRNGGSPGKTSTSYTQAAVGAALAHKTRKNGKVSVVFGGEEESETWHEALQIASVHGLPMIFVNHKHRDPGQARRNSRKVSTKKTSQPETPWFPTIAVDSNDVVAVYRVANEAISRARQGRGPTLIECQPFRLNGTPKILSKSNGNGRHAQDPILNMEHYLRGKGLFQPKLKREIVAEFTKELAQP